MELCIFPLASVFSFIYSVWYGFVDLLALSSGPWRQGTTLRYRFARLCGCFMKTSTSSDVGLRYSIGSVAPHHLGTVPLEKDLRWGGRILILVIMLAQYTQAAVLMVRRILSDTAAGVDYATFFLALSGLTALFRSLAISLLNVSWTLNENIESCTETLCQLPGCLAFKRSLGLPSKNFKIMAFGQNVESVPRVILYQLAGGYLQCSILLRLELSLPYNVMTLWVTHIAWRSTICCVVYTQGFWRLAMRDEPPDLTHSAPDTTNSLSTGTLPDPVAQGSQSNTPEPWTVLGVLVAFFLGIVGIATIAWLCLILCLQLLWLVMPTVALWWRIASETAYWKHIDGAQPCLQLWKDGLEDELWWF